MSTNTGSSGSPTSAAPSSSTASSTAAPSSAASSTTVSSTAASSTTSSAENSSSAQSQSASSASAASSSTAASISNSVSQSQSVSASASSASAVSSTVQSTYTTQIVVTVTGSNGSTFLSSSAVVTSSAVAGNGTRSSNVGPIVGGVVGGVGGLILLAGLLWFCLRKRKNNHRDDFDDMMFDPTRAQNHAQVDLADNSGATVEPFYTPGVASTATSPEMAQYPRSAASTSEGGFDPATGVSRGPSSASSAGYAGRGAGQFAQMPMPMPTIPDQYATGAGMGAGAAAGGAAGLGAAGLMNAKQREAYQEHNRFHVANQAYGQPGGSGTAPQDNVSPGSTSPGGVTVHTDGGRIPVEEDAPVLGSEIPPTYDSIRR